MTTLTWNNGCSVGVRAMDDQHGILLDTLNELRIALVQGRNHERVTECMERLIEFTRLHFFCEEHLLEQHGFPAVEAHREAHQRLLGELESVRQRAIHPDELHMAALLRSLREWYLRHVEDLDRAYGLWLNERGIC